jgi:hypothetical protein
MVILAVAPPMFLTPIEFAPVNNVLPIPLFIVIVTFVPSPTTFDEALMLNVAAGNTNPPAAVPPRSKYVLPSPVRASAQNEVLVPNSTRTYANANVLLKTGRVTKNAECFVPSVNEIVALVFGV